MSGDYVKQVKTKQALTIKEVVEWIDKQENQQLPMKIIGPIARACNYQSFLLAINIGKMLESRDIRAIAVQTKYTVVPDQEFTAVYDNGMVVLCMYGAPLIPVADVKQLDTNDKRTYVLDSVENCKNFLDNAIRF